MILGIYIYDFLLYVMNHPIEDGEIIQVADTEYLFDNGELTEIACSYPDMETGLAALQKSVD